MFRTTFRNEAEAVGFAKGAVTGVGVVIASYSIVYVGSVCSGTSELVPGSASFVCMLAFSLGYIVMLGKVRMLEVRLKEAERRKWAETGGNSGEITQG
jgi:hypothetical protein